MTGDRGLLARIEAAAVRAWPALETADISGWLWRFSNGGFQRANSVSALAFDGDDVEAAIEEAERRYRTRHAPTQFQVSDVSAPPSLVARLAARGYREHDPCITLAKLVVPDAVTPACVILAADPTDEWFALYASSITADRSSAAPRILAKVPPPRAFALTHRAERPISTALGVADGDLCAIQCLATADDGRRQGGASEALAAIESWARRHGCRWLYLQTGVTNIAAMTLYKKFGFVEVGRYHYRVQW
ncbi:MAG TPA: GNAT family N-acetyltransferase [Hyphomicrobiaceae bacterium]|nr:GNAT family N-acetyltransferase [Hyphomicrobiaceae bacterium]